MTPEAPDMVLCPMTADDLEAVLVIEAESYPRPWTRRHFLDEISSATSFPCVAFDSHNKVVGYICTMLVLDEGHILNVAVSSSFRRRGLGRFLVLEALRLCRERDAAFVSLEVRVSNVSAIDMYRRLGFTETGRRKRYYENGEDAILMEYIFSEDTNAV